MSVFRIQVIFVFFLLMAGCSTAPVYESLPTSVPSTEKSQQLEKREYPKKLVPIKDPNHVLLDHKYFQIGYDKQYRLPRYVRYTVTAEQLKNKNAKRKNKFIPDPILAEKNLHPVVTKDYVKSGYDRGHMAPSADFSFSQEANNLTFVMSNMAPQSPNLNQKAWKRLEEQVRKWGCGEERITVITGPILTPNLAKLKSGIPVPEEFYKIVIDETPPKKTLAFIYNQKDDHKVKYQERITTLENVLQKANLNPGLFMEHDKNIRTISSLNDWKEAACGR